jgi:hypothetical protein
MQKILELNIPIRLISEANTGFSLRNPKMTWIRLKKRKEAQKNAILGHWREYWAYHPLTGPSYGGNMPNLLPCIVRLTRIAPRNLNDDNLAYAFKHCRDVIADLIRPGYAFGRADDTDQIKWEYAQEKGQPKQYGIKIEVFS